MLNRYYTLTEVSKNLHTSVRYLKELIDKEKIKAIKTSKNFLISEFEYLKLVEAMEVKNGKQES